MLASRKGVVKMLTTKRAPTFDETYTTADWARDNWRYFRSGRKLKIEKGFSPDNPSKPEDPADGSTLGFWRKSKPDEACDASWTWTDAEEFKLLAGSFGGW